MTHAELLSRFVEAVQSGAEPQLSASRQALQKAVGAAGLVDACGVIAHFNMMTRIADGTGIPLDPQTELATHELRADLGIEDLQYAEQRRPRGVLRSLLGRVVKPLAPSALRVMSFIATRVVRL